MEYRRGWRAFIQNATPGTLRDVDRQVWARIWSYARPYKGQMALVLLGVLVQTLIGLAPPLFYRHFIDTVLPARDVQQLFLFSGLLLAMPAGTALAGLWQHAYAQRLGETLVFALRQAMFKHVHRLSMRFFTHTREGEIVARFTQDVDGARRMVTHTVPQLASAGLTLGATAVVMANLEWRLAVPGLLLFPLLWPFAYWLARILRRTYHQGLEYNAQLTSLVGETLNVNGALLMKLFGQQASAQARFRALAERVRQFRIRWSIMSYWLTSGLGILSGLGVALCYGWGGWLVIQGEMTVGTIVAMVAYLPRIYQPIAAISHVPVELIQGVASFERVFAYMDEPIEIREDADARTLPQVQGRLTLDQVSFAYAAPPPADADATRAEPVAEVADGDAWTWALQDVTFTVEPGQTAALVGLSGAGKSTLIHLVMRIYDPTCGRVLLDGHDLRRLSFATLASHIGMVTQDAFLFSDTLRANLLYARPDASDAELENACAVAQLRAFVQDLPAGLDTRVGERGYRLSGGERQRVAIARAILKQPSVLLLDEATSHLDSHSESLVQRALQPLLAHCTSLVIAHRLSTVRNADTILVLDKGRVAEAGPHAALIRRQGLYTRLYDLQYSTQLEA